MENGFSIRKFIIIITIKYIKKKIIMGNCAGICGNN